MFRTALILTLSAVAISAAGCRMCASPYDDCGPTFSGQCGESCDANARSGSILAGYQSAMQDGTVVYDESVNGPFDAAYDGMILAPGEEMMPTPAPATTQAPRTIAAPPIPGPTQGWAPPQ